MTTPEPGGLPPAGSRENVERHLGEAKLAVDVLDQDFRRDLMGPAAIAKVIYHVGCAVTDLLQELIDRSTVPR